MTIDSYSFGTIIVNSKSYHRDIIVFPEKTSPDWQRTKGHSLALEDIKEIIDYKPEILVIGTGAYAGMTVPESTKDELINKKIKFIEESTQKACEVFNTNINNGIKAVGAFHLTC